MEELKKPKSPFEINWPLPSMSPWPGVWPRPCPSSSPGMPTISWGTTWRTATSTTTSATSMSTTFFGIFSSWFRAFRRTIVSRIPFGFYFSHHFFQLVLPVQTGFLGPDFTVNFGPLVCLIWKKEKKLLPWCCNNKKILMDTRIVSDSRQKNPLLQGAI